MKNLNLFPMLVLLAIGCGGGGSSGPIEVSDQSFSSIEGRWKINADEVIAADCDGKIGSFIDAVTIDVTDNNAVSIDTFAPFSSAGTEIVRLTGSLIPGGLVTSATTFSSCRDGGQTDYMLSIENIPSDKNNVGVAQYSYSSVCGDGTTVCSFTVRGPANHLPDNS